MKRLSAILLCVILVLSMTVIVAGAAENDRTIAINHGKDGETYTAYKIFDVTYDTGKTSYSYTINGNSEWFSVVTNNKTNPSTAPFTENGLLFTPIATSSSPVVYTVEKTASYDESAAAALAAKLYKSVRDKTAAGSVVYDKDDTDKQSIGVTGTGDGYYFVTTSAGTLCALDTSNPTITIDEKNPENTVDKEVKEDSATAPNDYFKSNDAQIGDTVEYKTTVTIVKGAKNLVLHDTMTEGLTPKVDSVMISGLTMKDGEHTTDYDYEVIADTANNGFTVAFAQSYLDTLTAATTDVVVTYSATLNEHAVIGGTGNVNTTYLTYGNSQTTQQKTTTTYTYEFSVLKTDNTTPTANKLAGAKFTLSLGGTPIEFVAVDAENGVYRVAVSTDAAADKLTVITTGANGKITYQGLDADTYVLQETEAPAGYNKLPQTITVQIAGITGSTTVSNTAETPAVDFANGTVFQLSDGQSTTINNPIAAGKTNANEKTDKTIPVVNAKGGLLPSTGGLGTTIFYTVGGILVVGAVILLISRKRMKKSA